MPAPPNELRTYARSNNETLSPTVGLRHADTINLVCLLPVVGDNKAFEFDFRARSLARSTDRGQPGLPTFLSPPFSFCPFSFSLFPSMTDHEYFILSLRMLNFILPWISFLIFENGERR